MGLRGTLSCARDLACTAYLFVFRPCSTMCVDGNQVSRIMHLAYFPHKTFLKWQGKMKRIPYNKTGTNYGILSAVGESLIEDWNSNETVIPAK